MLKLKRLTIHKLPRVKPGTELVFNEGINVLLGVNGSGKTTLLKLLVQVLNGRFEELADSEFHLSYECERDGTSLSIDLRSSSPAPPQRDIMPRPVLTWSMRIDLRGGELISMELEQDRLVTTYRGETTTSVELARMDLPPRLTAASGLLELESVSPDLREEVLKLGTWNLARFDEALQWFNKGIDAPDFNFVEVAPGVVIPTTIEDFLPDDAGQLFARQLGASPNRDDLGLDDSELKFLAQTCAAFNLTGASMQLELLRKEPSGEPELSSWYFGQLRFRFTKADGTRLRHDQLSFGQQRLFAFLYYAAIHKQVIVADELSNGLHHAMIARCIDVIGERQAFLATQNPLLLDNLGFTSAEEVRGTFILCSTQVENHREQVVWRNMTTEEAENFYRDYKAGISHVHDILRSRGLW